MSEQSVINQSASNIKKKKVYDNKPIWAPFFKLIFRAKLPYGWIVLTFLLGLSASGLTLMFPDYTQRIIGGDISVQTIGIFALVLILSQIVSILISIVSGITEAKITKKMRTTIWQEIINIPIHILEKDNAKEMISRTTQDTTALSNIIAVTLPNIVSTMYILVGSIIAVNAYHSSLMISLIVLVLLQLIVIIVSGKVNYTYNNKVQLKLAQLTEHLSEVLTNIPLVKIFVTEDKEVRRGKKLIERYYKVRFKYDILNTLMMEASTFVNRIGIIVVIISGMILITKKTITLEQWIAYFLYYQTLQDSLMMVPYYWMQIKASQGITRKIAEITCLEKENYESGLAFKTDKSSILFQDVSFSYENKVVLNNFTMEIPYKKTTALVGENGAGKSTILSLIERFYYPSDGKITYGEIDINQYKLKDWRKTFGYVSQDIKLMSGTIYENLTYGLDTEVSKEKIVEACKQADALEFINSFEEGFDTQVGEFGGRLSGGQRQRICIARVILSNPPILLLDEFTSNLDIEAQDRVKRAMDELCKNKTTIVIAHRMSTLKNADNIVVIQNGCTESIGNHETLLNNNEYYKKLIDKQAFV